MTQRALAKEIIGEYPQTDTGNAELFAERFADTVRYDHLNGRWLIWNQHRWEPDTTGAINRLAIDAIRWRGALAMHGIPPTPATAHSIDGIEPHLAKDDREAAAKHAFRSESISRLDAVLRLSRNLEPLADNGEDWDNDPLLLGVLNGVVDLTGDVPRLRNGRPEDRITQQAGAAYDPEAECPRWEQFIDEIFGDDAAMIAYIQRAIGYSLTGSTKEQVMFLEHGAGSNGKSVFMKAIKKVLGDYGGGLPYSTLEDRGRATQQTPYDLATLRGKRFAFSSETNDTSRFNVQRVKAIVAGDPTTARFMRQDFFTFTPIAKVWLAMNDLPEVKDQSHAFWRRVHLIDFAVKFASSDEMAKAEGLLRADDTLEQKLEAELPGILAWAVRGFIAYQSEGLSPPAKVLLATQEYRASQDPLGDFLLAKCDTSDSSARETSANLFTAYTAWAHAEGYSVKETMSRTKFGTEMGKRFTRPTTHGTHASFNGVRLSTSPAQQSFSGGTTPAPTDDLAWLDALNDEPAGATN